MGVEGVSAVMASIIWARSSEGGCYWQGEATKASNTYSHEGAVIAFGAPTLLQCNFGQGKGAARLPRSRCSKQHG